MQNEALEPADLRSRERTTARFAIAGIAVLALAIVAGPIVSIVIGKISSDRRAQFIDEAAPVSVAARQLEIDVLELRRLAGNYLVTDRSQLLQQFATQRQRVDFEIDELVRVSRDSKFERQAQELVSRAEGVIDNLQSGIDALEAGDDGSAEHLLVDAGDPVIERFLESGGALSAEAQADIDRLPGEIEDLERIELAILGVAAIAGLVGAAALLVLLWSRRKLLSDAESERARFTDLVESIGLGVLELERDGTITYLNPAATKLLGYEAGELVGQAAYQMLHHTRADGTPNAPQDSWAYFGDLVPRAFAGEDHLVRKDGTFLPVDVTCRPTGNGLRSSGAVVVFQDISDRLLQRQMQEDFVALTSHELRGPLTSVQGFAQWLDRRAVEYPEAYDDPSREAIRTLRTNAERMSSTLRLFVQLATIEGGKFVREAEPVSLGPVLSDEADALRRVHPAATIQVVLPDESVIVESDEDRIREVVTNLLQNAARHGGESVAIRLRLESNGDTARVIVQDDGPGIPAKLLPTVFERGRSTQTDGQGMGLGLYISREIAVRLGGELSVDSAEGEGAVFTFALPLGGVGEGA